MKEYLKKLKDEDRLVEIWTVKVDRWDNGFVKGRILEVYDNGVAIAGKEDVKFIPFNAILRIIR